MNRRAAVTVLTALGLLLAGLLLLALISGIGSAAPRVHLPPPNLTPPSLAPPSLAPRPTRPALPRATIEGLIEGSGPTVNPQNLQENAPPGR